MKTLPLITLAIYLSTVVNAQNEEVLQMPLEADNQYPPDHIESEGVIEGSGEGVVEEPNVMTTTELIPVPNLENIDSDSNTESQLSPFDIAPELPCPKPCVCSTEGDNNNFIVDCSGYDLTEFPTAIDPRTTTLKLHNNKLSVIPKDISALKKLQILNLDNNSIMELAAGSVSELPELVTLKLAKNRLIEYPNELKNSISLTKLEELDLGDNDMRTDLTPEMFSNFKSLRKLTLPTATTELVLHFCKSLKNTLEAVCTINCNTKLFDCPDAQPKIDENLFDATLPGMISLSNSLSENEGIHEHNLDFIDQQVSSETSTNTNKDLTTETNVDETTANIDVTTTVLETEIRSKVSKPQQILPSNTFFQTPNKNDDVINSEKSRRLTKTNNDNTHVESVNEFSLRAAVNNEPPESSGVNAKIKNNHEEVKVGAKTLDTKSGGVDKSVIGVIVAGMIIVVAAITIKKNWNSITKRFNSSPRPNERIDVRANGSSPEEVPLQDKLPV